jgi:RNA polymerase sigma-70 factor (ECF subfamily)
MTDAGGGVVAERTWIATELDVEVDAARADGAAAIGRRADGTPALSPFESIAWPEVVSLVRRQMRSLMGADRELDDVAQVALERIVRGAARFEGRAAFSTYAYRVCIRVALNHWRARRRWRRWFSFGADDRAEPTDHDADPGAHVVLRERARRLHAILERMDPLRRLVLTLADLEEMPVTRIAEILRCPEPTVKSRLRLAREDLAVLLARDPYFREELRSGGAR